ncbi:MULTISPECIES: ImmA/IrrE family metallo-endopeptidase [Bacillus cereus group]|uniref:ImmA/IrrE family metallo-endopeptidase n=1 Tax=Bacillus cereus group TaxID=86661 RepID=UPI000BF4623B|nr:MULTISPECIES: ImmA/IrrE family metallo-endopeptidase [Bacillus cereus group]PFI78285.1 ImmA/IrrE family metallo-endopeptidase [Bacillus cereus]
MFTAYEKLLCEYEDEVQIKETKLLHGFKGLYYDGRILIDSKLTEDEKHCILAEEMGHHFTSSGNIIDQKKCANRQQELKARNWAYEKIIPLSDLVSAQKAYCTNHYEIAEYLCVSQEFLEETLAYYFQKYGNEVRWENFLITFEPLNIIKL